MTTTTNFTVVWAPPPGRRITPPVLQSYVDTTMARHDDVHTMTNVHTSTSSTVVWRPQCQRIM